MTNDVEIIRLNKIVKMLKYSDYLIIEKKVFQKYYKLQSRKILNWYHRMTLITNFTHDLTYNCSMTVCGVNIGLEDKQVWIASPTRSRKKTVLSNLSIISTKTINIVFIF